MNTRTPSLLAATITLFAATTLAQAPTTPIPWPVGCAVPSTLENNGAAAISYMFCTPTVTDANGQIVTFGLCLFADLLLGPGETSTAYWNQTDMFGLPVAPGIYVVNGVPYDIGAANAALQPLGSPHPGTARTIELCSPADAGAPYLLAASFSSSVGIPLGCGVHFPLDFDWLLGESLGNPAVFANFLGTLDASGRTTAPAVVLPPLPILVGIGFDLAFLTLDPTNPCGLGRASGAVSVTIR